MARNVFTANANEVPAALFFTNVREGAAYNHFGFAPRGNIEIAERIAAAIVEHGGEVRTGWEVSRIEIEDGLAVAIRATAPDGQEVRLEASAVVSNAGPTKTAEMVLGTPVEEAFRERVADVLPTSMLALSLSTTEDFLADCPGMLNFTDTDRLCSIANLTALCPELAPEGRTLYDAFSVAAVGGRRIRRGRRAGPPGGRPAQDAALVRQGRGRPLQGDARRQPRAALRPSNNPSVATPVPNMVDVGDGVRPGALIGTSACAMTAAEAVELLERASVGA